MFLGENVNGFFWTPAAPAASREFANHRAGSQLKNLRKIKDKNKKKTGN